MKIQNTITQAQLEMLLRLANAMHTANAGWRYGQSVFNAIALLLPDLAEEIRGNSEVDPFNWLEDYGVRWTKWYAMLCPDEPREIESLNVGEIHVEEFDMEYTDEEIEELNEMTRKALELRETVFNLSNSFTKKHK